MCGGVSCFGSIIAVVFGKDCCVYISSKYMLLCIYTKKEQSQRCTIFVERVAEARDSSSKISF